MNRFPLFVVIGVALLAGLWITRPSSVANLGPADGHDLAPVDTGRVSVGDAAPDFTLESRTGEAVTLSELRGRRIVLVFYRGHW